MSLIAILLVCSLFAGAWLKLNKRRLPLPPGPRADPIIGHARSIPAQNQAATFQRWTKTYGDLVYLKVFGREMVVIGSFEAAQELLENRGGNYCCRPPFIVWEMMGWWPILTFLPYGKFFLKHRRVFQQYFGRKESLAFTDIVADEARLLVLNLSRAAPGSHLHCAHRFTTSNIMRVACGKQVKSDDDPFMTLATELAPVINNSGPMGNTFIDIFPWLKHFPSWFPGTYYASYALSCREATRKLHEYPVQYVKAQLASGNVERSFVSELLTGLGDTPDAMNLVDIKGASATVFAAAEDTTFASLTVFFLAMILHPEHQKRAYQEIITVIGEDRLPEYRDRGSLPFVESILQETLRWHPPLSLAIPHRSLEDDVYNDRFIPKGTIMIPNVLGMSLDDTVYSDPKAFNPVRFLSAPEGKGEPHFTAVWGFGRRICPGRHFADITLWYAMVHILAVYEILPAKDNNGNLVQPEKHFTEGLISQVEPYHFEVRLRSEAARALISQIED
ncbi:hypothetical protein VNI00_009293 [Paramarasmius palmivorus]|uniref:Cytochrome P450 n=1 Tax=Paramarasmius palmivorus TaxID=297713 RepID=A0AAW0CRH1_9AGAR